MEASDEDAKRTAKAPAESDDVTASDAETLWMTAPGVTVEDDCSEADVASVEAPTNAIVEVALSELVTTSVTLSSSVTGVGEKN